MTTKAQVNCIAQTAWSAAHIRSGSWNITLRLIWRLPRPAFWLTPPYRWTLAESASAYEINVLLPDCNSRAQPAMPEVCGGGYCRWCGDLPWLLATAVTGPILTILTSLSTICRTYALLSSRHCALHGLSPQPQLADRRFGPGRSQGPETSGSLSLRETLALM